jgi:hypothetical protein
MDTLYRVYLGRNIGDFGHVSDADLKRFLGETVAKSFQGFSVASIQGYWNGKPEESAVIEIAADGTRETDAKVGRIAEEYCQAFNQESVMVARVPLHVEFVERARVAA